MGKGVEDSVVSSDSLRSEFRTSLGAGGRMLLKIWSGLDFFSRFAGGGGGGHRSNVAC